MRNDSRQRGQLPYGRSSKVSPLGWGLSFAGGGMAGPARGAERARAGEDGEYHHSRNFTKKIAVGRMTLSESSNSRGEDSNSRRKLRSIPCARAGSALGSIACCAARCKTPRCSAHVPSFAARHAPDRQCPHAAGPPRSTTATAGSTVSGRTDTRRCARGATPRRWH